MVHSTVMSEVTHVLYGVRSVDTIYVLLVRLAFAHLKILFCLASPETVVAFLQEDYRTMASV